MPLYALGTDVGAAYFPRRDFSLGISENSVVIGDDVPSPVPREVVLASRHSAVCFQHDARLLFDARRSSPALPANMSTLRTREIIRT